MQDSLSKGQSLARSDGQTGDKSDDDDEDHETDDFGFFEQKGVPYRVTLHKMTELI